MAGGSGRRALLATAIFTPIVAWASLRYAEVRQFAESDPLLFIGSIALQGWRSMVLLICW